MKPSTYQQLTIERARAVVANRDSVIPASYPEHDFNGRNAFLVGYLTGLLKTLLEVTEELAGDDEDAEPPATPDPDACKCGHPGYEHIFTGTSPCTVCDCKGFYSAATAILARAIEDGTPVIVEDDMTPAVEWARRFGPYCTSAYEPVPGHNLLCELAPGHDGRHRSIGYRDGDAAITWTDEHAPAGAA